MECQYRDRNNKKCGGNLVFVAEYTQGESLVTCYECEKCGSRTGGVVENAGDKNGDNSYKR